MKKRNFSYGVLALCLLASSCIDGLSAGRRKLNISTAQKSEENNDTFRRPLSINPAMIDVSPGGSIVFHISGGTMPYRVLINRGACSILEIYSDAVEVKASVTDGEICTIEAKDGGQQYATASLRSNSSGGGGGGGGGATGLYLRPSYFVAAAQDNFSVEIMGGEAPFTCNVLEGGGTCAISGNGLAVTTADGPNNQKIEVRDSRNVLAYLQVTVRGPLVVSPLTKENPVNYSSNFTFSGGVAPIKVQVIEGQAKCLTRNSQEAGEVCINQSTSNCLIKTATVIGDRSLIQFSDARGKGVVAELTSIASGGLSVSPSGMNLASADSFNIDVSSGKIPYQAVVVNASKSDIGTVISVSGTRFKVDSAQGPGSFQVQIQDAEGRKSLVPVDVAAPLEVSPSQVVVVAPSSNQTFTYSGGVFPITARVKSGQAQLLTKTSSTVEFKAPASGGTSSILEFVDNRGKMLERTFQTTGTALTLSPSSLALAPGQSSTLAINGGNAPFSAEINPNNSDLRVDSLVNRDLKLKAGDNVTSTQVFTVTVRDSTQNTIQASVTVYASSAFVPNDPLYPANSQSINIGQWGLKNSGQTIKVYKNDGSKVNLVGTSGVDIGAEKGWALEYQCSGVLVAVIDAGVDLSHPDLSQNIQGGNDFFSNTSNAQAISNYSHGTHISGIISARGNNGTGVTGVCAQAKIMPLKVFGIVGGELVASVSHVTQAIYYAANNGAKVINMSLGVYMWTVNSAEKTDYYNSFSNALEYARGKNILAVAAAGNADADSQYLTKNVDQNDVYPCTIQKDNLICVASIQAQGYLSDFSFYGPQKVHIAAPGDCILSLINQNTSSWMYGGANGNYDFDWGTSMATAFVSGVAAAINARFPDSSYSLVRSKILDKAVVSSKLDQKVANKRLLNLENSLK